MCFLLKKNANDFEKKIEETYTTFSSIFKMGGYSANVYKMYLKGVILKLGVHYKYIYHMHVVRILPLLAQTPRSTLQSVLEGRNGWNFKQRLRSTTV